MEDNTCEGCIFMFVRITDDNDVVGKCHRYPAQLFMIDGDVAQAHPDANERCGEFKSEREFPKEES